MVLHFSASVEPLVYQWRVASLSHYYRYCFGGYSPELAELFSFSYFCDRFTPYSNGLFVFSVTIPRISSSFSCQNSLCNSLPAKCCLLIYDRNDFQLGGNAHFLPLGSFQSAFLCPFTLCLLVFLFALYVVVTFQPCLE